jgi:hypothetical protein
MAKANERVFQGKLLSLINRICNENPEIGFSQITQEENVGTSSGAKFADNKLYSSLDSNKIVSFELKGMSWDATDEALIRDAHEKASTNGFEYFVTGTPKQLVLFRTFEAGKSIFERKLKIFNLSRIQKIDDVLSLNFEKEIAKPLKEFLIELSNIVHGIKEVSWTSIDEFFANKLSIFILEATENMFEIMYDKIQIDKALKTRIKDYLRDQDIFNVSINFYSTDIYNLCQLSNYLLYLKIIFYSYLQREVPKLQLKKLEISDDKHFLNKTLKQRFSDVLNHDFEYIFQPTALDEFEFPDKYLATLKRNVEELNHLNFKEINADIIGNIYNTLIDNQEQHDRGQHFTNTNEVDLICGFCLNKDTQFVLDSGCGAGTFLVRAYKFMKLFNPKMTHTELMERLWGIDIAQFPIFLAMMNLSLLDIACEENYPSLVQKDFSTVSSTTKFKMYNLDVTHDLQVKKIDGKIKQVKIPNFDACVGNPPYIRQELIQNKEVWAKLATKEFDLKKINQQSDLYVYYLIHTAAFLKPGCRMGYVIASSWLDVNYGTGLQKFILDNFKIIAIIDNQKKRSFDTASINTVIIILEKCNKAELRKKNNVKFIRIFIDYKEVFGTINDIGREKKVLKFIKEIENNDSNVSNNNYSILVKNQNELEESSTVDGTYQNGYWGAKYLRASEIYYKIKAKADKKMIPLSDVCDVWRGFTSGANNFFYLSDDTRDLMNMTDRETRDMIGQKIIDRKKFFETYGWYYSDLMKRHYLIEKKFLLPLFKTQKEANKLDVDLKNLKYFVLICNYSKKQLKGFKYKVLDYINDAESHELAPQNRPTCISRVSTVSNSDWYMLGENLPVADFIFPSKIGEKYRLIDNRKAKIFADKVNYNIVVKKKYKKYSDYIFLYLNSITFRFFLDLFSRQLTGNLTYSDVDVNLVEKTPVINPELFEAYKDELKEIYNTFKSREQGTIFEEISAKDRIAFEKIVFDILGLKKNNINELFKSVTDYVSSRQEKSDSLRTVKNKSKLNYEDIIKLTQERFNEIRKYDELVSACKTKEIKSYNLKAKFPDNLHSTNGNFFEQKFYVYFILDAKTKYSIILDNNEQVKLFEFLVNTIEIREKNIKIPINENDSKTVLEILKEDYNNNIHLLENYIKSNRFKVNAKTIYKELLF